MLLRSVFRRRSYFLPALEYKQNTYTRANTAQELMMFAVNDIFVDLLLVCVKLDIFRNFEEKF